MARRGGGTAPGGTGNREILFEFIPMGNAVKVCAVDSATGTEVSIVAPAGHGTEQLKRVAAAKLRYRLSKDGTD